MVDFASFLSVFRRCTISEWSETIQNILGIVSDRDTIKSVEIPEIRVDLPSNLKSKVNCDPQQTQNRKTGRGTTTTHL